MNKKLISIMFVMFLLITPMVSAVDLLSGTILNATGSNSTMTFTQCELRVDLSTISPISIELTNPTYITAGQQFTLPSFINFTDENANIDCGQLGPRFGTPNFQCTNIERGTLSMIIIISSLALVIFSFMFFISKNEIPLNDVSPKTLIMVFVGVIIGIVFIEAIANQIVDFCPL